MKRVIFACVHNAGRSQMAAAFFNSMADPSKARALSAGTEPIERVHGVVVEVMREVGLALSSARPQKLTAELARGARTGLLPIRKDSSRIRSVHYATRSDGASVR